MHYMINHPRILCLACLVGMWLAARLGVWLRKCFGLADHEGADNLTFVIPAALTLLGLIIGFTFSMATNRYDQRRHFEEDEANAIGTEYLRASLLPSAETGAIRTTLLQYLDHRVSFYDANYDSHVHTLDLATAGLQTQLWNEVQPIATSTPNAVTALVVSGMNDVLNSQGYTQFAWWNRIPSTAWGLLILVSLFANVLVGYAARRSRDGHLIVWVLPVLVATSFFLVSDIDSPRGGVIRVHPVDLVALQQQLEPGRR